MAVVGICKLIQMESMPTEIATALGHIFKALIGILSAKEKQAAIAAAGNDVATATNRFNVMEFLMDEFNDADLDSLGEEQIETLSKHLMASNVTTQQDQKKMENESAMAVNHLMTPLKQFDEFDHFRTVITGI
jgi:hypothetical protein